MPIPARHAINRQIMLFYAPKWNFIWYPFMWNMEFHMEVHVESHMDVYMVLAISSRSYLMSCVPARSLCHPSKACYRAAEGNGHALCAAIDKTFLCTHVEFHMASHTLFSCGIWDSIWKFIWNPIWMSVSVVFPWGCGLPFGVAEQVGAVCLCAGLS